MDLTLRNSVESWSRSLKRGFSFILDTNDEYDVMNTIRKTSPENGQKSNSYHSGSVYMQDTSANEHNQLTIRLKTISNLKHLKKLHK